MFLAVERTIYAHVCESELLPRGRLPGSHLNCIYMLNGQNSDFRLSIRQNQHVYLCFCCVPVRHVAGIGRRREVYEVKMGAVIMIIEKESTANSLTDLDMLARSSGSHPTTTWATSMHSGEHIYRRTGNSVTERSSRTPIVPWRTFYGRLVAVEDCDGCMMVAVLATNSYEPRIQFLVPGNVENLSCLLDSTPPRPLGLQGSLYGHFQVDFSSTGA